MRGFLRREPFAVYLGLSLWGSLFFALAFTTNLVYYVQVVGLDPLQMVLVGTILEGTILLCELPTGIVADVTSRKLSILIGYALTGLSFVFQATVPRFWAIALAHVVWGVGYTFASGAEEAWIADEIGPDRAADAYARAGQAAQIASLVGIALAGAVGMFDVALPVLICGLGYLALTGVLAVVMGEEGYVSGHQRRAIDWHILVGTVAQAWRLASRRPIVLWLLASGLVLGLYSEGYDRLWIPHMLQDVGLPERPELPTATWIAAIRIASALLSVGVVELMRRHLMQYEDRGLSRVLGVSALGIVLGIVLLAATRAFWLGAMAVIWIGPLRTMSQLLRTVWLNRQITDSSVRASVFSAVGQADSLGQVVGGPVVGWVAKVTSVPLGLALSATLLAPILPIYAHTGQGPRSDAEYTEIDDNSLC